MFTADKFRARTRAFAIDVIRLCLSFDRDDLGRLVRPQLLRAGTGVACNYRAACRSRSAREFSARLATVIEEADEAEFWLDMLKTHNYGPAERVDALQTEATELRAIFVRSRITVQTKLNRREPPEPTS